MKKTMILLALAVLLLTSCDDGTHKSYWDNGNLKSVLSYDGDVLNGACAWYYENGRKQLEIEYVDNVIILLTKSNSSFVKLILLPTFFCNFYILTHLE